MVMNERSLLFWVFPYTATAFVSVPYFFFAVFFAEDFAAVFFAGAFFAVAMTFTSFRSRRNPCVLPLVRGKMCSYARPSSVILFS